MSWSSTWATPRLFWRGFWGCCYIIRWCMATPTLTPRVEKDMSRMIYGTLCFGIIFSFVGTVLGGLWADDSWGRFWGWDPKENGALMIVLWNALVLHARWDGLVKGRGMALLAVVGNIVTAWSWFGVNELGVGLHSYGVSEGRLISGIIRAQPTRSDRSGDAPSANSGGAYNQPRIDGLSESTGYISSSGGGQKGVARTCAQHRPGREATRGNIMWVQVLAEDHVGRGNWRVESLHRPNADGAASCRFATLPPFRDGRATQPRKGCARIDLGCGDGLSANTDAGARKRGALYRCWKIGTIDDVCIPPCRF